MKKLFQLSLAGLFLISATNNASSQHRSQVRFKFGEFISVINSHNSGYAYKLRPERLGGGQYSVEFSQYSRSGMFSWFCGAGEDGQNVKISLNRNNFQSIVNDPIITVSGTTFRFYGGISKHLKGKKSKSPFSVFGGLDLATHFDSQGGGHGNLRSSEGVTKNGEQLNSPYHQNLIFPSGYQLWVYVEREFRIIPTVFTGIRWQPIRKKGQDGAGLEVLVNYAVDEYFTYRVPYTLNGVLHEDSFPEQPIGLQVNLLIPIKNFGYRKKK